MRPPDWGRNSSIKALCWDLAVCSQDCSSDPTAFPRMAPY